MTAEQLYDHLNYVDHSREKRLQYANLILNNPPLIAKLLDILFMVDDKISCRAAWVLEFTCGENLNLLLPHLDYFTSKIHLVHLAPAVRPVAKICEYLAKANDISKNSSLHLVFTQEYKERIISVCFDYMINDEKIAPKAYSMNVLYLFGKEFAWIHPELALLLERDFQMQSSGFKARARHILKHINSKK